jgi:hypothetical protein
VHVSPARQAVALSALPMPDLDVLAAALRDEYEQLLALAREPR